MATKSEILAILEGIDSDVAVKFKAVGAIPADSIVNISTTAHIDRGELDRSASGGDTQTVAPVVILLQG